MHEVQLFFSTVQGRRTHQDQEAQQFLETLLGQGLCLQRPCLLAPSTGLCMDGQGGKFHGSILGSTGGTLKPGQENIPAVLRIWQTSHVRAVREPTRDLSNHRVLPLTRMCLPSASKDAVGGLPGAQEVSWVPSWQIMTHGQIQPSAYFCK